MTPVVLDQADVAGWHNYFWVHTTPDLLALLYRTAESDMLCVESYPYPDSAVTCHRVTVSNKSGYRTITGENQRKAIESMLISLFLDTYNEKHQPKEGQ